MRLHSASEALPALTALLALAAAGHASGDPPVAQSDAYTTTVGDNLSVDEPGVLDNDSDPEGDSLKAFLVDASGAAGTLFLYEDGSLEYEVASGFVGTDVFAYVAFDGTQNSSPATITFTVEMGGIDGPLAFTDEGSFLAVIGSQGWTFTQESFEEPLWPRTPTTAPSVSNLGVTWTGNNSSSGITTGTGPAIFGQYGMFQLPHGNYVTGADCNTPGNCTDGWIATADAGKFVAAGIWIHCNAGTAGIEFILDGDAAAPVDFGGAGLPAGSTGFFGVIDGSGFATWEVHETEGKQEDASYIFSDLFTFALGPQAEVSSYGCGTNPAGSLALASGAPLVGTSFELGVDNPLGTQSAGSLPFVMFALDPAPGYPCGTNLPGLGMSAPGSLGELLVSVIVPNPIVTLAGAPWSGPGSPAAVTATIPNKLPLAGLAIYAQGVLVDPSAGATIPAGLTDALALQIGL